jgi:hypothetical protein
MSRAFGRLLLLMALAIPVGLVWGAPAHADDLQSCAVVHGAIAATPPISNRLGEHQASGHVRLLSCTKAGGSGTFPLTVNVLASCTSGFIRPRFTNVRVLWANHATSTLALTLKPAPGAPNRILLLGLVTSGDFSGAVVSGGMRLTAVARKSSQPCGKSNTAAKLKAANFEDFQLDPVKPASPPPAGAANRSSSSPSATTSTTRPPATTTTSTLHAAPARPARAARASVAGIARRPSRRDANGSASSGESLFAVLVAIGVVLCLAAFVWVVLSARGRPTS